MKYSNDENESVNDLTFKMHSYSDGKRIANENLLANKASKDDNSFKAKNNKLSFNDKHNVAIEKSNVISKPLQVANIIDNRPSLTVTIN